MTWSPEPSRRAVRTPRWASRCGAALIVCGCLAAAGASPEPKTRPTPGAVAASESLYQSAIGLLASPRARGRSARLVALCTMAERLNPHNADLNLLLADVIYPSAGRSAEAGAAAERYLDAYPNDHLRGRQWLQWKLDLLQTADERLAWLRQQTNREDLASPLRAEASRRAAVILEGQARPAEAEDLWALAERLDPRGNAVARGADVAAESGPAKKVRHLLEALRATGGGAAPAAALGETLGAEGLHEQAVRFHEHVWTLERRGPAGSPGHGATLALFNALLDAGRPADAISRFEPLLPRFASSVDFRSLLAEAYAMNGQAEEASRQIDAIEALYEPGPGTETSDPALARQLATFYLLTRPDPQAALRHARVAYDEEAPSQVDRRWLGAAELASDNATLQARGRERLEDLVDTDVYASFLLAEHLFETGAKATATEAVRAGLSLGREGPAARRLQALAKRHGIEVPKPPEAIRELLEEFDERWLRMAVEPAEFVAVAAEPVRAATPPGEPVEIAVVLRNIGGLPVPVGEVGLLQPSFAVVVELSGGRSGRFDTLPLGSWPAPRYLEPDQEVRRIVRLDIGPVRDVLMQQPLESITIRATIHANPIRSENGIRSSVTGLEPVSAEIVREDLLGEFDRDDPEQWSDRYRKTLGWLVGDLQQGDLSRRLRAVRQIGSLVALARLSERGTVQPPRPLHHTVELPVLLSMLREALSDSSDVVRAETVDSLRGLPLNRALVEQVSAVFEDPSPLVRLRVAELLGTARPPGWEAVLDRLAEDPYDAVRWMAGALAE